MAKSKCKHKKLILVSVNVLELIPDQEPFEAGVIEAMDEIHTFVLLSGHYCPACEKLVDIAIESQE